MTDPVSLFLAGHGIDVLAAVEALAVGMIGVFLVAMLWPEKMK